MKLRYLFVFLTATAFTACNKEDDKVAPGKAPNTDTVAKSTINNGMNWGGTAPLSMFFNNTMFYANDDKSFYKDAQGTVYIYAHKPINPSMNIDTQVVISFPGSLGTQKKNTQYSIPESGQITYAEIYRNDTNNSVYIGTQWGGSARIQIAEINTNSVEGRFYGTLKTKKSYTDKKIPNSIEVTYGYFRFALDDNKPK